MDKTIIIIPIHSIIDIITNSSSELFVCNTDKSTSEVRALLGAILTAYGEGKGHDYCFSEVFGDIKIADHNELDWHGWGFDIHKGDLIITSESDNTIPWGIQDIIEDMFCATRHHLG